MAKLERLTRLADELHRAAAGAERLGQVRAERPATVPTPTTASPSIDTEPLVRRLDQIRTRLDQLRPGVSDTDFRAFEP